MLLKLLIILNYCLTWYDINITNNILYIALHISTLIYPCVLSNFYFFIELQIRIMFYILNL